MVSESLERCNHRTPVVTRRSVFLDWEKEARGKSWVLAEPNGHSLCQKIHFIHLCRVELLKKQQHTQAQIPSDEKAYLLGLEKNARLIWHLGVFCWWTHNHMDRTCTQQESEKKQVVWLELVTTETTVGQSERICCTVKYKSNPSRSLFEEEHSPRTCPPALPGGSQGHPRSWVLPRVVLPEGQTWKHLPGEVSRTNAWATSSGCSPSFY